MNLQKIALLTGLSVASIFGSGALSPAHAIVTNYEITGGTFSNGGTLRGYFKYDGSTYTDWSFSVTQASSTSLLSAFTYSAAQGSTLSNFSPSGFTLDYKLANPEFERTLVVAFDQALPLSIGQSTTITKSTPPFFAGTREFAFNTGATNARGISGGIVTAVPWETDALPLVGATMVFGAGVFAKRKIAQGKIKNLNFEPVKSECLSNVD
ncbi:hypothetical protein [Dolichospermum flos-aquae]|uniref:Uncharacterized protein n=1 Tax=Dolichospermum flos-aquae LEGE 04289 TaxID=1828708 RepID=A0ACC5PX62_DOLFA|nr:hypothetical protein [Dolichospermum flos-aquae]MBE9217743.1 hypothetical protein [Dolichospermum flos-aquae LEGE 04289]